MKRVYIVATDEVIQIATVNECDAIEVFKRVLKHEGIEFDMFKYDTRIRIYNDVCRITYHYIDADCVPHVIKVYTEELEGID